MHDFAIFWDWLSFAVRWLHVITAIAWIGSSFYFIALDLGLREARRACRHGAHGEEWQVHGGGFYHIQKYLVAPARMPEHLTWFKWESYATWLSGFALLAIVYYAGADLYLIDRNVLDVSAPVAILISLGSLAIGWLIYDLLCKSPLGNNDTALMLVLYVVLVAMAWGYTQLFTGRAAFLHLGAFTATIMSANVFLIIIPNQKIVVADLKAGRAPDPKYGKIAKQRSLHNNYLTLPVIFLMLSNHYPLAFATEFNWVIASLIFMIGVADPALFQHDACPQGQSALDLGCVDACSSSSSCGCRPCRPALTGEPRASARAERCMASAHFAAVRDTVIGRCSMCHAAEPGWEGIHFAPKGVLLDDDAADRRACARDLSAGRPQPRHAARQRHRHDRRRARAAGRLVRGAVMSDACSCAAACCPSSREPEGIDDRASYRYEEDGGLLIRDGKIVAMGDFHLVSREAGRDVAGRRPSPAPHPARLHRHACAFPADAGDRQLWRRTARMAQHLHLSARRRASPTSQHGRRIARLFLDELIRHGTTTVAPIARSIQESADAFFAEAAGARHADGRRQGDDGPQRAGRR